MAERQNAAVRKPQIIETFYAVIAAEGLENASIAKVARRMEVNPSLIIHYFGNKESMLSELVETVLNAYSGLFRQLPENAPPEQRLTDLLALIWSPEWQTQADRTVFHSIHALGSRDPVIGSRIQRLYDTYKKTLTREMGSFMNAGIVRIPDPVRGAEILMSMSEGSHYFQHYYTDPAHGESHRKDMITAALLALGADPGLMRTHPPDLAALPQAQGSQTDSSAKRTQE